MIENFIQQLKKAREQVMLRADRKAEIRAELESFMRGRAAFARPARARTWVRLWRPVFAAFAIFVLLGAGTTYASEQTLPGSPLYGVKLLKEEIQARLIADAEMKAEWEAIRAERRLEEAARLAAAGNLSSEMQADLEARFAEHAERVGERIEMFEAKENFQAVAGLTSRFEASLDAHSRVLANLEARKEVSTKKEIGAFKQKVEQRLAEVKGARVAAEAKVEEEDDEDEVSGVNATTTATSTSSTATTATGTLPAATSTTSTASSVTPQARTAAEQKIEAAEKAIAEVEAFLRGADSEETVEEAEDLIESAREKLQKGSYADAFRTANQAIREAQESKIILKLEKQLKLKFEKKEKAEQREQEKEEEEGERSERRR